MKNDTNINPFKGWTTDNNGSAFYYELDNVSACVELITLEEASVSIDIDQGNTENYTEECADDEHFFGFLLRVFSDVEEKVAEYQDELENYEDPDEAARSAWRDIQRDVIRSINRR